jgi:hypothetical protein
MQQYEILTKKKELIDENAFPIDGSALPVDRFDFFESYFLRKYKNI